MRVRSLYVLGCGGTGSHFVAPSARLLSHHEDGKDCRMILRDGDFFEKDNLARQMCSVHDTTGAILVSKAECLLPQVTEFVRAEADSTYVQGGSDLHKFLFEELRSQKAEEQPEITVFLLSVDRDASRKIVYDELAQPPFDTLNVAVIDPGNDLHNGQVGLFIRMQGEEPFCDPRKTNANLAKPMDRPPGGGCAEETASTPQLITANMMAATLSLHVLFSLLDNGSLCDEVMFDLKQFKVAPIGEWIIAEEEVEDEQLQQGD